MAHISTIKLLVEWARWGQAQSIDYPTMSPMFGERALKTPLYGVGHLPTDVFEVERAVCALDWRYRDALIARYQRKLTWAKMGQRMGRSWRTARRTVIEAEDFVQNALHNVGQSAKRAQDSNSVSKEPRVGFFRLRTA
jgi:hypothetical protein